MTISVNRDEVQRLVAGEAPHGAAAPRSRIGDPVAASATSSMLR
jgi:hypothetical protein